MNKKVKYHLDKNGEFIIENYHMAKPFSSFFPGIAGAWGVPMWVFYVNRGQAIASFGIKDKDHSIMEFQPANKSYQLASLLGFRTLIKISSSKGVTFYDAFHNGASSVNFDIDNAMAVSSSGIRLKETNRTLGLETGIEYFTVASDNYAALARKMCLKNTGKKKLNLELLDGLPQVMPYGVNNFFLKELSRTIEAWMQVENLENKIPYLRLKVDPSDRPEVVHISEGNFYLAFNRQGLIKPIVDPQAIFGCVDDFTYPKAFLTKDNFAYPKFQRTTSQTPCCMAYQNVSIAPEESITIYSLSGNMDSLDKLQANSKRIAQEDYFNQKRVENKRLINGLCSTVFTHSGDKGFDFYCRQNFLDNVMRGGFPLSLEEVDRPIQAYSRKHGDLERDYNRFLLEPTYFSQGNGNYRDANQNRRNDIWFNPRVKDLSILTFFNLIQADGYNPLIIKPDSFMFKGDSAIVDSFFPKDSAARVRRRLEKPFTPGELFFFIEHGILKGKRSFKDRERFLGCILRDSSRILNAEHGEGFWSDHWTYCLDMLESYLSLYPEDLEYMLLENKEFTFFDNSETVKPRKNKYVLKGSKVFQYHSVANNHQKSLMIKKRAEAAHIVRVKDSQDQIYKVTLLVKMLVIIANKFSCLDPFGIGIEMEADKPNWYDSLNGLPGLLGSSACETFELSRWIVFLKNSLKELNKGPEYSIGLAPELFDLLEGLNDITEKGLSGYDFWDRSHSLREDYLNQTLLGFSAREKEMSLPRLESILNSFLGKINQGLDKAYDAESGMVYSYFINEVVDYQADAGEHGHSIKPLKFRQRPLPLFLEGLMHYLRVVNDPQKARNLFKALRKSNLYDKRLKMYKVTESLSGMAEEIGRCRIFAPGWLENESIWLHMEYKYIYELIKNGLYKEFFEDFKNILIPFQNPARYGRSILENSSFLVSSVFPDKRLHGNGFVARLSGSTAEFISIWLHMCLGGRPFYLDKDKNLCLEFKPVLPGWIFSKKAEAGFSKNTFAFKLLNTTLVVYHNPKRKDTFGQKAAKIKQITLELPDKTRSVFNQPYLAAPIAGEVRSGGISRIDILLG